MQKRALALAVAVLLALGVLVWRMGPAPPATGDDAPMSEQPLLTGLTMDEITGITIGPEGKGAHLERLGDGWVVQPGAHPAEPAMAQLALRALTRTRALRGIDPAGPLADYGLGEGALEVRIAAGTGQRVLRLGDTVSVGGGRYVSVDGAVGVAQDTALGIFDRDPLDYRDRRLLPLDRQAIEAVTLHQDGRPDVRLRREEGRWRLGEELTFRADAAAVDDLLRDAVGLSAETYAPGGPPDASLTLRLATAVGEATLLLGPLRDDGRRSAWAQGDALPPGVGGERATVLAPFLETLPEGDGWRSRALFEGLPKDILGFRWEAGGERWILQRGDGTWTLDGATDEPPPDPEAVDAFLSSVAALRAAGFAEDDTEDGAVETARLVLDLRSGEQSTVVLLQGPNMELARVDEEPGLLELSGDAQDLLGRLRPFTKPTAP